AAAGSYSVAIAAAGLGANATLTNRVGPPASLVVTGGDAQTATVGTDFAAPLAAKVTDASSNPVPNTTVTFTAPTSGPSLTFAGGTTIATATTDATGTATAPAMTANASAGTYSVDLSAAGLGTNATLTNQVP